MKFQSQIISRGSGSIGGLTASHNKGGNYFRARVTPVNPQSAEQVAVRTIMGTLMSVWVNTLTAAQRAAWKTYADNVQLVDQFGDPRNVTALNMYARCNVPRIQAGFARVDAAPTVFNLGDYTPVSLAVSAAAGLSITFDNTDGWANEDDAGLIIYQSRTQNPSINFFKGPYRLVGSIAGDAMTPPTSPDVTGTGSLPFSVVEDNKTFARIQISRADGRLSTPQALSAVVSA